MIKINAYYLTLHFFFRSKKLAEIMSKKMTIKGIVPHFLHISPVSILICYVHMYIYIMFMLDIFNWINKSEESMEKQLTE